jgi:hypothetical protein
VSQDGGFVEVGGDASGLVAALLEAGNALITFAALSESQVARINSALADLGGGAASLASFRTALGEIGATAGVDTLVTSLQLVSREFETNIGLVQQLRAELGGLAAIASAGGNVRAIGAAPVAIGSNRDSVTGQFIPGGSSGQVRDPNTGQFAGAASASTELTGQWSRELVQVGSQTVEVFQRVDTAAGELATRLNSTGGGAGGAAGGGRPTYSASGFSESGGGPYVDANGTYHPGSGGGAGGGTGGGATAPPPSPDEVPKGFFAQFAQGFGGGAGKDSNPLAQQIGSITKYTLFYGTAYKILGDFQQGLVTAVQQLEEFQKETVNLAEQMGTTTTQAAGLATALGNVAAANGQSAAEGVAAGARGIGLFGLNDANQATQAAGATTSAQVSTQAAFISGLAVPVVQGQIAAVTQGFGLGVNDQQQVSDVSAYLDRKFGQTPLSSLAGVSQIAGTTAAAGFDLNQTTAAVAYLQSRTGSDSTTVASSLAAILAKSGNPLVEQKLSGFGVDTSKTFFDQLQQLSTKNLSQPQLDQLSTVFGGRKIANTANLLVQGFGDVAGAAGGAATDAAGASQREFNNQMNTFKGLLTELHANLNNLLKDLGNSGLLGIFGALFIAADGLVKDLDLVVQVFDKMNTGVRVAVASIGLLSAVLLVMGRNSEIAAVEAAGPSLLSKVAGLAGFGGAAGAAEREIPGQLALTTGADAESAALGRGLGTRLQVGAGRLVGGVQNFASRDVSGTGVALAGVAVAAFALSLVNATDAINAAHSKLVGALDLGATAADSSTAQSQQDQLKASLDAANKADGGTLGTLARGSRSFSAQFGFGGAAQNDVVNANQSADAKAQVAALGDYASKLQDLQQKASINGGAGSIDFTTATTVTDSFNAIKTAGGSATDQMNSLIASLNSLGESAKGTGVGLDSLAQQKVGLEAGAAAASQISGGLSDKGIRAPAGFDLTTAQDAISQSTYNALAANGGKLSPAQIKDLVASAQLQATSGLQAPDVTGLPKSMQTKILANYNAAIDQINQGVSLGVQTVINQAKNGGATVGGGVDIASIEASVAAALGGASGVGTEAQQSYLQGRPGDTTGAASASTQAQITALTAVKAKAAEALAAAALDPFGGQLAGATQTFDQLNNALIALGNDAVTNAVAQINAYEGVAQAYLGPYEALGKIEAQLGSDQAILAKTPDDPAAQAKVLNDKSNAAQQKVADAAAATLAGVKPGDTIGAANAAAKNARDALTAIGPEDAGNIAAYAKAQGDVATTLQNQALAYNALGTAEAQAQISSTDPLEAVNVQITGIIGKIKADGAGTLAAMQDQATLNGLLVQQANDEIAQQAVTAGLAGDSTNPAQVAARALATAQQQQAAVDANPKSSVSDKNNALAATRAAKDSADQAAFSQQLSDQQTEYQLGQESLGSYLQFLDGERSLLGTKLAAMNQNSDGYYQAKKQLDQINQAIQAAATSANAQFNLANIKIPTPYEVRRYIAGDQSGATGAGSNTVTINFDGSDLSKVQQVLGQYLGPNVIDSYSSITRKVG